jgi:sugar lactone lactonase YvrE
MLRARAGFSLRLLLTATLLHALPLAAQPYTFTNFVGPVGGADWFDATGTNARFNNPWSVVADASGNVYVADSGNSCIRKVAPGGIVTTFAGECGAGGFQNGAGGRARFSNLRQLAIDGSGNIYVADAGNQLIRRITPGGIVTTVAGTVYTSGVLDGPVAAARFNWPTGIARDAAGNLYVADRNGHVIRKISGGSVSTLAGVAGEEGLTDSPARFNQPTGLAVDASGSVYVADSRNYAIRKITAAGVVSTFAGLPGTPGDADGNGTTARFREPIGISIDASGNFRVADLGGHSIRMITPAGDVTTVAGTNRGDEDGIGTAAGFLGPHGVVQASDGNLYVANLLGHSIRRITPAAAVSTYAGRAAPDGHVDASGANARFRTPSGMDVDVAGNLFVADRYTYTIRKVTPAGAVSTFAGQPLLSGSTDGAAGKFDGPIGLAIAADGSVYVAEFLDHTIRKVTAAGVISTLAGTAGSSGTSNGSGSTARFNSPFDLAVDTAGNIFVADQGNHTIRKITPAGSVTTLAGLGGTTGAVDGSGSVARFNKPSGIARDATNNLYVADRENHAIRKITPVGAVTTFAGLLGVGGNVDGPAGEARFYLPEHLTVDATGNVFVFEQNQRRLRKITPAGVVTTVGGGDTYTNREGTAAHARFHDPEGLAVSSGGILYISELGSHSIKRGLAALSAVATIDQIEGPVDVTRQLGASPNSGTTYAWSQVRRPTGSAASLSSLSAAFPTFTPDKADLYEFRLDATNTTSGLRSITFVRLKAECNTLTVGPSSLPDGLAGTPYSATFSASGGTGPYTFGAEGGYLPGGFTLSAGGALAGNPPAGVYGITVVATDSAGCTGERYYFFTIYPYPPPTGLVASNNNTAYVFLTWNAVSGAAGYRIYRRSVGSWYTLVGEQPGTSHSDFSTEANKAYMYAVRARDASGNESKDSNVDVATTVIFTDPALPAGTVVKETHVLELRTAVNALGQLAGLTPLTFADPSLAGIPIKANHLVQLRTQLNSARTNAGLSSLSFTDASPTGVQVKAVHLMEIRSGLQ